MQNFELVQKAYDELINSGEIKPVSDQLVVEQHKALLTRRAAYYLNQLDSNYGLVSKTTGNNVIGLSTDIVAHKQKPIFWDIATDVDAGNGLRVAKPINSNEVAGSLIDRWVQPTKELAGLTNDVPIPSDKEEIVEKINKILDELEIIVEDLKILNDFDAILQELKTHINKPATNYSTRIFGTTVVLKPEK